jgi:hypothetical protein
MSATPSLYEKSLKAVDKGISKTIKKKSSEYKAKHGYSAKPAQKEIKRYELRKSLKNEVPRDVYDDLKKATDTHSKNQKSWVRETKKRYKNHL